MLVFIFSSTPEFCVRNHTVFMSPAVVFMQCERAFKILGNCSILLFVLIAWIVIVYAHLIQKCTVFHIGINSICEQPAFRYSTQLYRIKLLLLEYLLIHLQQESGNLSENLRRGNCFISISLL